MNSDGLGERVISTTVRDRLIAAGWYPGRKVDVRTRESHNGEKLWPRNSAALAVLEEFNGLCVPPYKSLIVPGAASYGIHFDDYQDFHMEECVYRYFLCQLRTTGLYPIGESDSDTFYLDDHGAMYLEHDSCLYFIGSTFWDAMNNAVCDLTRRYSDVVIEYNEPELEFDWLSP